MMLIAEISFKNLCSYLNQFLQNFLTRKFCFESSVIPVLISQFCKLKMSNKNSEFYFEVFERKNNKYQVSVINYLLPIF